MGSSWEAKIYINGKNHSSLQVKNDTPLQEIRDSLKLIAINILFLEMTVLLRESLILQQKMFGKMMKKKEVIKLI